MSSTEKGNSIYFPTLDTLRLIAFALVYWSHGYVPAFLEYLENPQNKWIGTFLKTGVFGVHIFFVISGFLITYLLLLEMKTNEKINVGRFYLRRILRIWPLYYLVMGLGIFILPVLFNSFQFCDSYWQNLLFLNNYNIFEVANCFSSNVGVAWSVAVEEQFYLLWPIVFIFFYKSKQFIILCLCTFICSIFYILNDPNAYVFLFGNLSYLIAGCLGAYLYFQYGSLFNKSKYLNYKYLISLVLFLLVLMILSSYSKKIDVLSVIIFPFIYLYFVIYSVVKSQSNRTTFFSELGKYTYGMYFYHIIILVFVKIIFEKLGIDYKSSAINLVILATISLPVVVIVSILSYKYFELYFLKLKNKFSINLNQKK